MRRSASTAVCSSSAATAATSSPTKRTSSRKIVSSPRKAAFGALKRCSTPRAAGNALLAVDASPRSRDLAEFGSSRRDRKILAFDEDERLEDLALELLAALDDARHQDFLFPAETPAFTMFGYAPQRQRLPATARRTSSSVGAAFSRSSATIDMIWPGVQKPHWNASASMKARWTGCSSPSFAIPSMVSTAIPSQATARVMHE